MTPERSIVHRTVEVKLVKVRDVSWLEWAAIFLLLLLAGIVLTLPALLLKLIEGG